jgi:hypothetical protein
MRFARNREEEEQLMRANLNKILLALVMLAFGPLAGPRAQGYNPELPVPAETSTNDRRAYHCSTRMQDFVEKLDGILRKNPRSIDPFLVLLREHFPLRSCDIKQVLDICSKSKYFIGVGDNVVAYVLSFNSAKFFDGNGFYVQFGLEKQSGDSRYPSAGYNRPPL